MEGKDDACKCRARSKAQKKYQIIPDQVARLLNRREKQGEGGKGKETIIEHFLYPSGGGGGVKCQTRISVRRAFFSGGTDLYYLT